MEWSSGCIRTPHSTLNHSITAEDSHFVCPAFSAGCDTSRCQTTAWNASACGVTLSGFTVGTITQASAIWAV